MNKLKGSSCVTSTFLAIPRHFANHARMTCMLNQGNFGNSGYKCFCDQMVKALIVKMTEPLVP